MPRKLTREEFIEKAKVVHGDKYDYSKVEYKNNSTKVCIICKEHGEFWQQPNSHLSGKGCSCCCKTKHLTTKEFIQKAQLIYGNKYDYSKVKYINAKTKVCIICPTHGEFWQTPSNHLLKHGCSKCTKNIQLTKNDFIEKAKAIHGNKYDYFKSEYINSSTKILIRCPQHGEFWQMPLKHLYGKQGCPKCANKNITTEEFIEKARKIHGNRYDYSKVEYIKSTEKVCIICKEHGEFWQEPNSHLQGHGCPHCQTSQLEKEMSDFLNANKINFEGQKKFDWLGLQSLDFYLPQYKIGIECQGEQHFICKDFFGGKEEFEKVWERDKRKNKLCINNGVKIIYYSNLNIKYPYQVFENKEEILQEIKKG